MVRERGKGRVYNFNPFVGKVGKVVYYAAERGFDPRKASAYGILHDGVYEEYKSASEVLERLLRIGGSVLSFGGMSYDFHAFKGLCTLTPLSSWTLRLSKGGKTLFLYDLRGNGSFSGYAGLEDWARAWGVSLGEGLEGRLRGIAGLMEKLFALGAEFTPGRTARKKAMEWLKKPIISLMPYAPELVGARTQVFFHRARGVNVYDVNSMYPGIMVYSKLPLLEERQDCYAQAFREVSEDEVFSCVNNLGPVWEKYLERPPTPENLSALSEFLNEYYILKVRIKGFHAGLRPPFPFAGSFMGKRAFHYIENGEYHAAGYEVPLLFGYKFEVVKGMASRAGYLPIRDRIRQVYEMRLSAKERGDEIGAGFYKAILNALYGIFGIKNRHFRGEKRMIVGYKDLKKLLRDAEYLGGEEYGSVKVYHYADGAKRIAVFRVRGEEGYAVRVYQSHEEFAGCSAPGIAVSIPANGRFFLYWMLRYFISKGHRVFYCDTDSVHTSCPPEGVKELMGDGLLRLKHEGYADEAFYFAPKTYCTLYKGKLNFVAKGVQDFEDERIMHSFAREEPLLIIRRAIDPESVPLTVEGKDHAAVLNVQGISFKETELYGIYSSLSPKG